MLSKPPDAEFYDGAIYLPRISKTLLEELAGHLQSCCDEPVPVDRTAASRVTGETPLARTAPSSAELSSALATIGRAAALMVEFQTSMRSHAEFEQVERGLMLLSQQVAEYERGFGIVSQQLRFAKDEAEQYKERSRAAEEQLDLLMDAVSHAAGIRPGHAYGLTVESRAPLSHHVSQQGFSHDR